MRGIVDQRLRRRPIRDDFVLCYNDIRILLRCVRREMGGDDKQDANGYSKLTMVSRKEGVFYAVSVPSDSGPRIVDEQDKIVLQLIVSCTSSSNGSTGIFLQIDTTLLPPLVPCIPEVFLHGLVHLIR